MTTDLWMLVFTSLLCLGLRLVYVTARRENLLGRLWAMQQLHMLGVGSFQELRLMPSGTTNVQAYKTAQRAELAGQGARIVLNMGDQWTDFAPVNRPGGNGHYSWTLGEHELCLKLPHALPRL